MWGFFGIESAKYEKVTRYGKSYRTISPVHFDNSITQNIPSGSASWSHHKRNNKHYSHYFNKFMNTVWVNQYVESYDIPMMEHVIRKRLLDPTWYPHIELRKGFLPTETTT